MTLELKPWVAAAYLVFSEEVDRLGHDKFSFDYKVTLSEDEWKQIARTLRKTGTWQGPITCQLWNRDTNEKYTAEANVHLTNYFEGNPIGDVRVSHAE